MNSLHNIQTIGHEYYPMLVMTGSAVITFFLFFVAVVHILTEPRLSAKGKILWIILCLILVFPIHIYNTFFIKNKVIKHFSWLVGVLLLISSALYFSSNIIHAVQEKSIEYNSRPDIVEDQITLNPNDLPEAYHNMYHIIARVLAAQRICSWSPEKRLSFISKSDIFLYKSVQYLLKNTPYTYADAEDMLRAYQKGLIDKEIAKKTNDSIDKESYCRSSQAENLKLFYLKFIENPEQVQKQMRIPTQ